MNHNYRPRIFSATVSAIFLGFSFTVFGDWVALGRALTDRNETDGRHHSLSLVRSQVVDQRPDGGLVRFRIIGDRSKIAAGVRKACQGRPVGEDDLAKLAQEVEELIRARGLAEINAHEVGLTILEPLSKLDAVAYLRFASVYQAFENLEDFEEAIARLREDRIAQ